MPIDPKPKKTNDKPAHKPHAEPDSSAREIPGLGPDLGPRPEHLPSAPKPAEKPETPKGPANAPELGRASGADTRAAAARASIPDHMRGMLNNLNRIDQPGDLSDEEARRLAGQDTDLGNPRPENPENLPDVRQTRQDIAHIGHDLAAAGTVNPKWHSITHMPGFQNRQIRGMGGDLFRMFTTTPHQDILTISTQINTDREVKAVLGWLKSNADEQPEVHIDYSGYGMPGYQPEVKEFRTGNTRFHVVHDQAGWYIYAYPEHTAVDNSNPKSIGYDSEDDDYDEYGAPKRLNEDKTMTKITNPIDQIRKFTNLVESAHYDSLVLLTESEMAEVMSEAMLDESTLSKMIKHVPGGQSLVRYLHSIHKLGNDTNYEEVPERLHARSIKADKDNFAIIVGDKGVAGVKPLDKDWDMARNPEQDNTMRYVVAWSNNDDKAAKIEPAKKWRLGLRDGGGGTSGTEGGAPNLFQVLIPYIGNIQGIYRATGAVERTKMGQRAEFKKAEEPTIDKIVDRLKPIVSTMLRKSIDKINDKVQTYARGGNYDAAGKLANAAKNIQLMQTALDSDTPDWGGGYNAPLRKFKDLVNGAVREVLAGKTEEEKNLAMMDMVTRPVALEPVLFYIRQNLLKLN